MLTHPQFEPVAISLGPLQVHWYGLMYVIGFLAFLYLGKRRTQQPNSVFKSEQVDDMMFWGALGVVLGGRIGYMFFYNFREFLGDPLSFFQVWDGGMSFHGGLIGVTLVMVMLSRRWKVGFFQLSDFVAPLIPIGLGAGRIGNFINGELWGRQTDVPWGMVFPQVDNVNNIARHPSQLYQAFLEGLVLFALLWWFSRVSRPVGAITGLFIAAYAVFRIVVECFRQPDAHMGNNGYIAFGWLTQGQLLSLPMLALGLFVMWWAYRKTA